MSKQPYGFIFIHSNFCEKIIAGALRPLPSSPTVSKAMNEWQGLLNWYRVVDLNHDYEHSKLMTFTDVRIKVKDMVHLKQILDSADSGKSIKEIISFFPTAYQS